MKANRRQLAGWILSALLSAFLIFASATGKFIDWEGKTQMFEHLGYSNQLMTKIGVVEVIIAVLFLIPRTGFLGAVLLTAYLGGATSTHVRVGDPYFMPILIGVVAWISYGLRKPEVFSLAIGSPIAPAAANSKQDQH